MPVGHVLDPFDEFAGSYDWWSSVGGSSRLEVPGDGEGAAWWCGEYREEFACSCPSKEGVVDVIIENVASLTTAGVGVVVEHGRLEAQLVQVRRQAIGSVVRP